MHATPRRIGSWGLEVGQIGLRHPARRAASKNKAIIILHDGPDNRWNTVAAVRQLMAWWIEKGFTLASLPQCLN